MTDRKEEVRMLMRKVREGKIPSSEIIVEEAFHELGYDTETLTPLQVRRRFNTIFHNVWIKTLEVLERYEENAYARGIPEELIHLLRNDVEEAEKVLRRQGFIESIKFLFERFYPYLRRSFLSVSQSRMTRGGRDFELQFGRLLTLLGIPYQKVQRAYRVDFMLPSDEAFRRNPTTAAIASAKRTLRERWREVVEELHTMRSPNIFLITADFDITGGHIKEICDNYRIHLVVWDRVKSSSFPEHPLVLSYTQWANERLPVLEQFWKVR